MIIGYTSDHTAMLDLDGLNRNAVKDLAEKLLWRFKLQGYIILKSSCDGWHVIFDRRVSWKNALRVIFAAPPCRRRWHGHLSWAELQAIKGFATLRISGKGHKMSPRIMEYRGMVGLQKTFPSGGQIAEYLSCRKRLQM